MSTMTKTPRTHGAIDPTLRCTSRPNDPKEATADDGRLSPKSVCNNSLVGSFRRNNDPSMTRRTSRAKELLLRSRRCDREEEARRRMAHRRVRNIVLEQSRRLKGALSIKQRKEVDAFSARWRRRILRDFFDSHCPPEEALSVVREGAVSEKEMLKRYATNDDLIRIVVIVAEFEISIMEEIIKRDNGSMDKSLWLEEEGNEGAEDVKPRAIDSSKAPVIRLAEGVQRINIKPDEVGSIYSTEHLCVSEAAI